MAWSVRVRHKPLCVDLVWLADDWRRRLNLPAFDRRYRRPLSPRPKGVGQCLGLPVSSTHCFFALAGLLARGLTLDPTELPSARLGKPVPEFDLPLLDSSERRVPADWEEAGSG